MTFRNYWERLRRRFTSLNSDESKADSTTVFDRQQLPFGSTDKFGILKLREDSPGFLNGIDLNSRGEISARVVDSPDYLTENAP